MTGKPSLMEMMKAAVEAHQSMRMPAPDDAVPDAVPVRKSGTLNMTNNAGGSAPPLVLMKRVEEPMASFSDLIASAHQLISKRNATNDDYEAALDALQRADRMVAKARRTTITHEDFDPNDFESPSDPSSDAPDGDEEVDDDWDDEEDSDVKKASEHYSYHGYGGTPSPATPSGHGTGPDQSADPYATGNWSTAGTPGKTAFDDKVDAVMERDGISRSAAMSRARVEAPKLYQDHQASLVAGPTRDQHARRSAGQATKSAPVTFYEDLVSQEMSRGCTMEMAKVRVAQLHGYDAQRMPSLMRKGADLGDRFDRIVKSIANSEYLTLEEATREARLRNPALYKALRSV
jgi:hypothetical protein